MSDGSTRSCEPSGPFALNQYGMSEGESVSPTLEGHTFTIRRNDDKSDFKFFDFTLSGARVRGAGRATRRIGAGRRH